MVTTLEKTKHNVLVVDDDEDDLFLLNNYFEDFENITLNCIQRPLAVWDYLDTLTDDEKPSIIFLDINMPLKSGFEILVELKNNTRYAGVPVVIFTTSSAIEDKEKARRLQADDFITKALHFSTLQHSITRVLQNFKLTS